MSLVALRDRPRARRVAIRWLQRWPEETEDANLEQAAVVTDYSRPLAGTATIGRSSPFGTCPKERLSPDAIGV